MIDRIYNALGFRAVRPGTPLASTEYRHPSGRTVQMRGEGALTEAELVAYCERIDLAEEGRDG